LSRLTYDLFIKNAYEFDLTQRSNLQPLGLGTPVRGTIWAIHGKYTQTVESGRGYLWT
jgi:hypothetical protein